MYRVRSSSNDRIEFDFDFDPLTNSEYIELYALEEIVENLRSPHERLAIARNLNDGVEGNMEHQLVRRMCVLKLRRRPL